MTYSDVWARHPFYGRTYAPGVEVEEITLLPVDAPVLRRTPTPVRRTPLRRPVRRQWALYAIGLWTCLHWQAKACAEGASIRHIAARLRKQGVPVEVAALILAQRMRGPRRAV